MDTLIRKRAVLKRKLTLFETFLNPIEEKWKLKEGLAEGIISEIQTRLEKFDLLGDEFEAVQEEVEMQCESDAEMNIQFLERDMFTNNYNKALSTARLIVKKASQGYTTDSQHVVTDQGGLQGIKLPTISLPKFEGKLTQWLEFKDTFESLIHQNTTITNIQKFHYLRSSLKEDAAKIIQSLELSSENYLIAWDLLCSRYNNKHLLIHNHVQALFEMPKIQKESAGEIRNLMDTLFKNLRALSNLNEPTKQWDTMLIYLITTKLDRTSLSEWEKQKLVLQDSCSLVSLQEFLISRADLLDRIHATRNEDKRNGKGDKQVIRGVCLATKIECYACRGAHSIYKCEQFLNMPIVDRINKVIELKLCCNCLCAGHNKYQCKNRKSCKICKQWHNTLLHEELPPNGSNVVCHVRKEDSYVILATAKVRIHDIHGNIHQCRVLLDSASQVNIISNRLANLLQIKKYNSSTRLIGVNNISSNVQKQCHVTISSIYNNNTMDISCFILPKVTEDMPAFDFEIELPENIQLADPMFNKKQRVDMLLGASEFWNVINVEKLANGKKQSLLHSTVFGWVVAGKLNIPRTSLSNNSLMTTIDLSAQLNRFWEIEDNPLYTTSTNDEECDKYFMATTQRDKQGRFVVRLPLKEDARNLGDSRTSATKRFLQLERKLSANANLRQDYKAFMTEYREMGHMSLASDDKKGEYILPHHAIVRAESTTTKLRVVFDGSAITSSGKSLNDLLHVGPTIQTELFPILLRFRQHKIIVCADIAKMYRQILVHKDDRCLQRILWRDNVNDLISIYELNTVTYGTASAPYLAIRCLQELANINQTEYPEASYIIKADFYVDDMITGFNSEEEAIKISKDVRDILNSACLPLRKWISNAPSILSQIANGVEEHSILSLGDEGYTKTLGVQWCSKTDVLKYAIMPIQQSIISKRAILSDIAKLFDPLGLVSPCIIISKIIIQQLWSLKLNWDDEIPSELKKKWELFRRQLININKANISRNVFWCEADSFELHGFCDASTKAYGACIYVRSIGKGFAKSALLCAKTKVAPLKSTTIPRLELCGALLLARLMKKVVESLKTHSKAFYWTDSQIVLCWIQSPPNSLQPFVGNRVAEIKSLTDTDQWYYVNTKHNPADFASRGISPDKICSCTIWWEGLVWLKSHPLIIEEPSMDIPEPLPEIKVVIHTLQAREGLVNWKIASSLRKVQRIIAYCIRFINNCRSQKGDRLTSALTAQELQSSMKGLVRAAQQEEFHEEIRTLHNQQLLRPKHKLLGLQPFADNEGLLRVGGRLARSDFQYDKKHPYLLPGKHPLTKLIITQTHMDLLHAGPTMVLATIRQRYWPTSGMRVTKAVLRNCVRCFRANPKPNVQIMGQLPKDRVAISRPFATTGVDYAGPYFIKDRKGRGAKVSKAYICLFICFATKAMHIELVSDLSTEVFLTAVRRFTSRRGLPNNIYSDNGSNFIGAKRELSELHEFLKASNDSIVNHCSNYQVTWHFIPPSAPHFGGLWESGVKAIKHHLRRVVGDTTLTFEELYTILVEIEAVLNSRPLCPLSDDPFNPEALTPSHFLIGQSLKTIPDPDLGHIKSNHLSRFQLLQKMQQDVWKRWSIEYLALLQQRNKWKSPTKNLKRDDLVVVKQDNLPPGKWLLGRIDDVYQGEDGIVRVATVRTRGGIIKRPVAKLCLLPLQSEL